MYANPFNKFVFLFFPRLCISHYRWVCKLTVTCIPERFEWGYLGKKAYIAREYSLVNQFLHTARIKKKIILAFYITCNKLFLHVGHLLIAFCVFTYKRNKYIYINIYSLPDCSNFCQADSLQESESLLGSLQDKDLYREQVSDRT